jgi:uncharacterized membrane protein
MIDAVKTLHVLAAAVLLGNLIMAPFWRKRLAASGDLQARVAASRSVRAADTRFTFPGWVVALITGLFTAIKGGFFRSGVWLHIALGLFLVWLVTWHVGVLRARKTMLAQAEEAAASGQATEALAQHERRWARWSYMSALIIVLIFIMMVAKPL